MSTSVCRPLIGVVEAGGVIVPVVCLVMGLVIVRQTRFGDFSELSVWLELEDSSFFWVLSVWFLWVPWDFFDVELFLLLLFLLFEFGD